MKKIENSSLIILSNAFSFLGIGMSFIASSWLIVSTTSNPIYVSFLVALQSIPVIFISPLSGAITDLFNSRSVAVFSDCLRGIITLLVPALIYFEISNIHYFIFVQVLMTTLLGSIFFPSMSSITKNSVDEKDFFKVLNINSMSSQISVLIGGAFAGALITYNLISFVYIIDALTYFISALCLVNIKISSSSQKIPDRKVNFNLYISNIREGLNYITKDNYLILLLFMSVIPSTINSIINSMLSGYTKFGLSKGAGTFGILEAAFSAGSIIMGILAMYYLMKKLNNQQMYYLGFLLMIFGLFILGLFTNVISAILALAFLGGGSMLMGPSRKTLFLKHVDTQYIGRVESMNFMLFSSIGPLVAMFLTFIVKFSSYSNIFLYLSITLILIFFSLNALEKKFRKIKNDEIRKTS